jgi:integrase
VRESAALENGAPLSWLCRRRHKHDRRHSCAALLIELGAHPKAIQERLGHSSITVTMDVYGLFPALNEALTDQLDDVFSTARAQPSAPVTGILRALPEA